jgi:hypothetical protein
MDTIVLRENATRLVHSGINDGIAGAVQIADVLLRHCLFQDKYLRDVVLASGVIEHCRFEHVNLRKATFDRINLTGSCFVACNLEEATFNGCTLWYVVFERCELNYESVLQNLPRENNIRRRFLRTLRTNAEAMGEKTWADRILLKELQAERDDLRGALLHESAYYKREVDLLGRITAGAKLTWHYVRFSLWGYGLYLSRLLFSTIALVAALATIVSRGPFLFYIASEAQARRLGFWEAVYYVVINLTTVGFGDVTPLSGTAKALASVTAAIGVVMFGFIAAAFYRRLSR